MSDLLHLIVRCVLRKKKKMHLQQFFDTAPYAPVRLMVAKIRYMSTSLTGPISITSGLRMSVQLAKPALPIGHLGEQ